MANIFNQVMNAGTKIPVIRNPEPGPESKIPMAETLPDASCEVIADPEIKSNIQDIVILPNPCTFAADRLKWSAIKGKFSKIDINPDLRAWMMDDSRVYNWIWTSIAVICANNNIDDDFPLPRDLEMRIPVPDDFREMFGVDPGYCVIVTRKGKNEIAVRV